MKIKGLARQNPVKACKIRNPRSTKRRQFLPSAIWKWTTNVFHRKVVGE
jgi:hypothetical protein